MFTVIPTDAYCPVQYVHIDIDRQLLPNLIGLPGCQSIPIARHNSFLMVSIDTYRPMQYVEKGIDQCLLPNCIVLKAERSIFVAQTEAVS